MNLALGGGWIDQRVGPFERHDAVHGHARVIDRTVKRGGRLVVFPGYLGACADFGYQFLLGVEVVGQLDCSRQISLSSNSSDAVS